MLITETLEIQKNKEPIILPPPQNNYGQHFNIRLDYYLMAYVYDMTFPL